MISLVSPAYNNAGQVEGMLASLWEKSDLRGHEVIVVDDGSADHAIQRVCTARGVNYLRLDPNRGACAARNAGARAARGGIVLFLDSDAVARADLIREAERALSDPAWDAAIGGPAPVSANPGLFRDFWALVKAQSLPEREGESTTFYPMIGAIRKKVFEECGEFDERFEGASVEDYEFSRRFSAHGKKVRYWPGLRVRMHYPGWKRNLRQSFSRAAKWVLLRRESASFDNHTTTWNQACGMLSAAAVPLLGIFYLVGILPGVGMALAWLIYLVSNVRFYLFALHHRPVWWMPVILPLHLLLGLVVFLGACFGAISSFFGLSVREGILFRRDA